MWIPRLLVLGKMRHDMWDDAVDSVSDCPSVSQRVCLSACPSD